MGKGDKKTKRGKIILGSSGVKRPKNKKSNPVIAAANAVKEVKEEKPAKKQKDEVVEVKVEKKAAEAKPAKKTTKKEPTAE